MHWHLWPHCSSVGMQIDRVQQPGTRLPLAVHAMGCHIFSLLWVSRRGWMSILFKTLKKTLAIPAALQDYSIVVGNKDFTEFCTK